MPDDTLLHIASFLPTARDLLRLQLTNRRFAAKIIAAPSVSAGGGGTGPGAAPERLSIVEEAARQWVAGYSEQERGWVPRRGLETLSWLRLMHEVEVLQLPLAFGRAHATITLSENGAVATKSVPQDGHRAAASKVVAAPGIDFAPDCRIPPLGARAFFCSERGIHQRRSGGGSAPACFCIF